MKITNGGRDENYKWRKMKRSIKGAIKPDYFLTKKYFGRGVFIELEHDNTSRPKWSVRILPSPLRWCGFKNKFDAILFASQKQGRSMQQMEWLPLE